MPFTGNRQFKRDPRIFTQAHGKYYQDEAGRQILDTLSGLWTSGLGHNVPEINAAIKKQLENLDFAPMFQFGHPGAFELAERLGDFMPENLNRVFFTNSGSEAVETTLKIARA